MLVNVTKQAKHADADYIWAKLADYSDFAWHPEMKDSQNIGTIPDGSENMVGAVRLLTKNDGHQLKETITAWSDKDRSQTFMIEGDLPPPVKSLKMTFRVREDKDGVFVDSFAEVDIKVMFCLITPILKMALPKKIAPIIQGIADVKEE